MVRASTIGGTMAVFAAAVLALSPSPAGASGPASADPASSDANGYAPAAILASREQLQTVSSGSTAGFPAAPLVASEPITPGATGWWSVRGETSSSYRIDSCGSSFPVEMTAYDVQTRDVFNVVPVDSTTDACANPIEGQYKNEAGDESPDVIRIDDATGSGGDYVVNYSRTPIKPTARIIKVEVGKVRHIKGKRRVGRARVEVRIHSRGEGELDGMVGVHCRLDGRKAKDCVGEIVYPHVRSGKHRLKLKVKDSLGAKATDRRCFHVPFRK